MSLGFYMEIFGDIGECIYCGSIEDLSDEHIVPYSLNGRWILPKASCSTCAAITSKFEREVTRNLLASTRTFHKFKTRREKNRPVSFPVKLIKQDSSELSVNLPIEEYGAVTLFPIYELPTHLSGNHVQGILYRGNALNRNGGVELTALGKRYGASAINFPITFSPVDFARLIAKIAYGFGVAHYDKQFIRNAYVVPAILNEPNQISRWVGTIRDYEMPRKEDLGIEFFENKEEIFARVQIFGKLEGSVVYLVVLGKK